METGLKTTMAVAPERVAIQMRSRFNPIRGLTPELLSSQLDAFRAGYLRAFAMTADAIEERDDVIQSVAPKRRKAVARCDWQVISMDDSREAKRHKEALEYFYNNLTCANAMDLNERGGFKLLVRQMMDAVGKKYAAHEIIWKPEPGRIAAEFRFVPLWFFENTTGKLRFLESDTALTGRDLEPGGWLVTVGDGIMVACSVAYIFKHLPLKDWLLYSERFGMPGIKGKTAAAPGSEEWKQMVTAVESFAADFACVMSAADDIETLDLKGTGETPYPKLVERMDRALATLWRGADLSTISKGDGNGASLQGDESDLIEQDDAEMIGETLNTQVDPQVIRALFGEGVKPLAYIKLLTETAGDIAKFKREVWLGFMRDGTVSDVMANLTDIKMLTKEVGLPTNEEYAEPYLPVVADRGLVTGETRKDSEGDIVGGTVDAAQPQTQGAESGGQRAAGGGNGQGIMDNGQGKTAENAITAGNTIRGQRSEARGQRSRDTSGYSNEFIRAMNEDMNPVYNRSFENIADFGKAVAGDLQPVCARLESILKISDEALFREKLAAFQMELPQMLRDINADPEAARVMQVKMAAAMAAGMGQRGEKKQP